MPSAFQLVRRGFELGGAISLLVSLGAAGVIASTASFFAELPWPLRVTVGVSVFLIALAALLAAWGTIQERRGKGGQPSPPSPKPPDTERLQPIDDSEGPLGELVLYKGNAPQNQAKTETPSPLPRSVAPPQDLKAELQQALEEGQRLRAGIPDRLTGGAAVGLYVALGGAKATREQVERWQAYVEALLVSDWQRNVFLYDPPRQVHRAAMTLSNMLISPLQAQMERRLVQLELVIRKL